MAVNDEVWVSDWNNDVVRRFSADGTPLPHLESEGLDRIFADTVQKRRLYNIVSYGGVVLVAFMLVVLVFRSVVQQAGQPSSKRSTVAHSGTYEQAGTLHLEPDAKLQKKMTTTLRLVGVLTALTVIPLVLLSRSFDKLDIIASLSIPIAGLFAIVGLIAWVNRANWGTFVKIDGDAVTLRDFTGRESTCSIRKVRYDDTAIATNDAVVILGRPKARIYSRTDVKDALMPRLEVAQKVSALEMMKIQIQLRHPQGVVTIVALAALLIYGIVYLAR